MEAERKNSMSERILAAAEKRARTTGYNGFSFRDLAGDVGVKSASIHYHFPTKAELGVRLAQRYRQRTTDGLGAPEGHTTQGAFQAVARLFVSANEDDDLMCLCGILGAEQGGLPAELNKEVAGYFADLTQWLDAAFGPNHEGPSPHTLLATLEGGLLIARATQDSMVLRRCIGDLSELLARA